MSAQIVCICTLHDLFLGINRFLSGSDCHPSCCCCVCDLFAPNQPQLHAYTPRLRAISTAARNDDNVDDDDEPAGSGFGIWCERCSSSSRDRCSSGGRRLTATSANNSHSNHEVLAKGHGDVEMPPKSKYPIGSSTSKNHSINTINNNGKATSVVGANVVAGASSAASTANSKRLPPIGKANSGKYPR